MSIEQLLECSAISSSEVLDEIVFVHRHLSDLHRRQLLMESCSVCITINPQDLALLRPSNIEGFFRAHLRMNSKTAMRLGRNHGYNRGEKRRYTLQCQKFWKGPSEGPALHQYCTEGAESQDKH